MAHNSTADSAKERCDVFFTGFSISNKINRINTENNRKQKAFSETCPDIKIHYNRLKKKKNMQKKPLKYDLKFEKLKRKRED